MANDCTSRGMRGFTLIEMMIVVVVIALLVTIAYPAYLDQVRKSRRAEGKSLLLQTANRQERFYATNSPNTYADSMEDLGWDDGDAGNENNTADSENGWYTVTVVAGNATGYTLRATAQGAQADDECQQMQVDQLDQRTATGPGGTDTSDRCW